MITACQVPSQDAAAAAWAEWNNRQLSTYQPKYVPASERTAYAESTSLRQFYTDCLNGKWEAIGRKVDRASGTAAKDRQALNRWERFTAPDGWKGPWPGPSLAFLEQVGEQYFNELWAKMETALSRDTVKSTRAHLQSIIRHAHRVRAILHIPSSLPLGKRDPDTRIYTPSEVAKILTVLKPHPYLEAAFQLILDCGPRAVDAFSLKRSDLREDHLGRRILCFESHKTGKLQGIPLTRISAEILDRLPQCGEYIFGESASPGCKDPEKSYGARVRNTLMKHLIKSVGITDVTKPWQVARATCNERYESHRPGVGEFILGHSLRGVNARSYRQPTESVHEAVRTLPPYTQLERQQRLFH